MTRSRLSPTLTFLAEIFLIAVLSACGEEPTAPQAPDPDRTIQFLVPAPTATRVPMPTATTTPAPTTTRVPAPTATPTTTPVSPGTAVPVPKEFAFAVTAAATWGDAFSTFTTSEKDCVRDTLEPGRLDAFAGKPIHSSYTNTQTAGVALIFSCLNPQLAGQIYGSLVALTFEDQGMVVGEAEVDCLRAWAAGLDWPSLPETDQEEALQRLDEISFCLADAVVPFLISQINQSLPVGLDDGQTECVRELLSSFTPPVLLRSFYGIRDRGPGLGTEEEFRDGMTGCVPGFYENQPPMTSEISMPFEVRDFLETHGIWHLAHNLLFIAHWDSHDQRWLVLDVAGEFTTDLLTQPAGVPVPSPSEVGVLTQLEKGKIYDFRMRWDDTGNLDGERSIDRFLHAGSNFIVWD